MVMLVMTAQLAQAAKLYRDSASTSEEKDVVIPDDEADNVIEHGEVIAISQWLKTTDGGSKSGNSWIPKTLNELLQGCHIYQPPARPAAPQTNEYKVLMARLRQEEEARSYECMIQPDDKQPALSNRHADLLAKANAAAQKDGEEITIAEVKRQATLIINVLVSIICTAVFLWIAARRWSVEARTLLSMSGALIVAVAEVVIFSGYLRRLEDAKKTERRKVEVKTIESSWVIESQAKPTDVRRRLQAATQTQASEKH